MRAICLQHVPIEDPGALSPALAKRGVALTTTRVYESANLPDLNTFEMLIVLGGPMSVNDTGVHAWLEAEKRFIAETIQAGKTVLGVCLGAQLVADTLGATVFKNPHREIGWFPVERLASAASHPLARVLPDRFEAFHWHGEACSLPRGAVHLARSEACPNQAFAWGDKVLALQFHLETTPAAVENLASHCPQDLTPGRYVQHRTAMTQQPERFLAANRLMGRILDALLHPRAEHAA